MLRRVFAVVCDAGYFAGLKALLNSLHAYHGDGIPVFVYESGFGSGELRWLEAHPLRTSVFRVADLPYFARGMWEAKQQVLAHCLGRARCAFLIDADIVITSPMDDVWAAAESGKIVAGHDGGRLQYDARYAVYGPQLPGQSHPHLNTGLICLDVEKHWDLAGLWAFSANYGQYSPHHGFPLHLPGHGDQGLFNALVARLGKLDDIHLLPHGLWHEIGAEGPMRILREEANGRIEVWNERLGGRQRLLHAAGINWWTENGARRHGALGDRLRCFLHFERWRVAGHSSCGASQVEPAGWERFAEGAPGRRILVAACSCQLAAERREAVRETWFQSLPDGVAAFFFVGDGRGSHEPDVARLPAADDYHSLPEKIHMLFRYVLEHYDFDYLFKCDDDTYLHAERLPSLVREGVQFIGDETIDRSRFAQGGAGYLLSRTAVEKLAETGFPFRGPEDVYVTRLAIDLGLTMESTSRLRSGPERPPTPRNDLVTAHHVGPEQMRRIHRHLHHPPPVVHEFAARHPQWSGVVELFGDGTFLGGAGRPDGQWKMSEDEDELILSWYHWPEDRLKRTESGFEGVHLRMLKSGLAVSAGGS